MKRLTWLACAIFLRMSARTLRAQCRGARDGDAGPSPTLGSTSTDDLKDFKRSPLDWENVELESSEETPSGFLHVAEGKSKNAVRNVPLTERAREVLLRRNQQNKGSRYVFPGKGKTGHIVTVQHAHELAARNAQLAPFEFYCWRHTFGTRQAPADKFSLAGLMGYSSPSVAERYYIHVTEPHVAADLLKFEAYRKAQGLLAKKNLEAFPKRTEKVQ